MRRPLITAVVLATVVTAGAGCSDRVEPRVEAVTRPPPRALLSAPAPTTTIPLPNPITIPDDPYAPEAVVEIGTMEIPKIGLTHAVFDGVTLHNIDKGPSHWPGTALPGQPGNAVFAGHRVTHDHPFNRVAELVEGDQVIFTINGTRTTYLVTGHEIVAPSDTWISEQTPAVTATLYACHPPGSTAQRYVVHLALAGP